MAAVRPIARLDSHEVTNQPPPFENRNLFATDRALRDAVRDAGGEAHGPLLHDLGRKAGSAEAIGWGVEANRQTPVLDSHDRYGRRIDEVRFHPAYHQLLRLGLEHGFAAAPWDGTPACSTSPAGVPSHGFAAAPWDGTPAGEVRHAAILFLTGQADSGSTCPMTMTAAAVPALRADPAIAAFWTPRILARRYDPDCRPAAEKSGVTIGMAMTEKQGGSDVRANSTRAVAAGDGWFRLTGHKWFCSAPMSDAFLTLAYADGGLSCFLLPRWLSDGARNAGFRIVRLKDKLGDRSNASSEVEYHGAMAQQLGEAGRGVATILQMVQHTRFDCVLGSAQQMRSALVEALWWAAHRTAFQKRLIDQPAMTAVLADLAVESEAATAIGFRLAQALDARDPLARLLVPLAKYRVCKRAPGMVYEAMECLGGNGYVETGPMARHFRQSPLNAIWEGSGNVIALDLMRTLSRESDGVAALRGFLDAQRRRHPAYDAWLGKLDFRAGDERMARLQSERLATAAQAATLLERGNPLAEAFCALRLQPRGADYGAFDARVDTERILERAMPNGE